jgi:dolichyl-phosphate beta-glucosyltransferase
MAQQPASQAFSTNGAGHPASGPMVEVRLSRKAVPPLLSIIIPAHNEEHRLPPSLSRIDAFLKTQPYAAEVIVVENGSRDNTAAVTREFARTHPYVQLLEVSTRGKGLAVKAGMLAAQGDYRFICDTDLSMPIEEITKFLPPHSDGYDISIATREGKLARRVGEPEYRHIMGRINNLIIQLTAVRGFEDTQCGFKMFSREAAQDLFSVQQMTGIGFDVEILFIAQKRGYRVREVPIVWYFDGDSRMRLIGDSLNIVREILQIRKNWNHGLYARRTDKAAQNRQPQL